MQLANNESPQKISPQGDASPDQLIPIILSENIEEDLRTQYADYRREKSPHPFIKKACRALARCAFNIQAFLHQFWREIMPEIIRGKMSTLSAPVSSGIKEKEEQLFSEFMKKRTPFFLIVFKTGCTQEEVQQAYISATNILGEGLSLRQDELYSTTSYRHWSIPNMKAAERYCIHVLKFDLFQKLLWFGTLSKAMFSPENHLERFKKDIDSGMKQYEKVEDSFLGSYVEKEDRFVLGPEEEK